MGVSPRASQQSSLNAACRHIRTKESVPITYRCLVKNLVVLGKSKPLLRK
jgi:hypothetical protein